MSVDRSPSGRTVTPGTAGHPAPRRRRGLARLADGRGLTAMGVVLTLAVIGGVGAAVDLSIGNSLGVIFAVCFIAASGLGALGAHREDLLACVVAPPLVFLGLVLASGGLKQGSGSGSLLVRQGLEVVNDLILGAPVLLTAAAVAVIIAGVRALGSRR